MVKKRNLPQYRLINKSQEMLTERSKKDKHPFLKEAGGDFDEGGLEEFNET